MSVVIPPDHQPRPSASPESKASKEKFVEKARDASLNVLETVPRERRLENEDSLANRSPNQRRIRVLDYIRRGQLRDANVNILPEVIQATPHLMEAGLVDFDSENYDEQEVIKGLLSNFAEIEIEVRADDGLVRDMLAKHGIEATDAQYLDEEWLKQFINGLKHYKKVINRPIHPKNPLYDKPEEYKRGVRKKTAMKLPGMLSGDLDRLFDDFEENDKEFTLTLGNRDNSHPVKGFVYKKSRGGFKRYPRMDEYDGEIIDEPPRLSDQRTNPSIRFVDRDEVPDIEGGIILDGNFGYDEDGNLITPVDKMIIDHHDQLDDTRYDTATVMSQRYWENKSGKTLKPIKKKAELKKHLGKDESGVSRITTMINHLDTDSILSVWAFRSPNKASEFKEIVNSISWCGDFLVGSRVYEYGASARDYEYIFRAYLDACKAKIMDERTEKDEEKLADREKEYESLKAEQSEFEQKTEALKRDNPEAQSIQSEIEVIRRNREIKGKEKGKLLREKANMLNALLQSELGSDYQRSKDLNIALSAKQKEVKALQKSVKSAKATRLSAQENEKIIAHLLSVTEDILKNPFKYQKYLQEERDKEDRTIQTVDRLYREGEIEIATDSEDDEILRITPLNAKEVPRVESIDGLYFFLRTRDDFNKKIIATKGRPGQYMVAINTQKQKDLRLYDFNLLIDTFKAKEAKCIEDLIAALKQSIDAEKDPKARKKLEKKLKKLESDLQKNSRGQLWRNRTQMIFAIRSYIPEEEFMSVLRDWKRSHDSEAQK